MLIKLTINDFDEQKVRKTFIQGVLEIVSFLKVH